MGLTVVTLERSRQLWQKLDICAGNSFLMVLLHTVKFPFSSWPRSRTSLLRLTSRAQSCERLLIDPHDEGSLIFISLMNRNLDRQQLTGPIPTSICRLTNLQLLSVIVDQQRVSWTGEPFSEIILARKRKSVTLIYIFCWIGSWGATSWRAPFHNLLANWPIFNTCQYIIDQKKWVSWTGEPLSAIVLAKRKSMALIFIFCWIES